MERGDGTPERGGHGEDGERDELARAVLLIDGVMQAEGVSPAAMDARLGRPAGSTAALLHGGEPERPRVLEILAALELEPEVFFRALYPETAEAPGAAGAASKGAPAAAGPPLFERLAAELALAGYAPHPANDPVDEGADPDPEELERRVREAIRAGLAGDSDEEG
jgi:hypothetical protein